MPFIGTRLECRKLGMAYLLENSLESVSIYRDIVAELNYFILSLFTTFFFFDGSLFNTCMLETCA